MSQYGLWQQCSIRSDTKTGLLCQGGHGATTEVLSFFKDKNTSSSSTLHVLAPHAWLCLLCQDSGSKIKYTQIKHLGKLENTQKLTPHGTNYVIIIVAGTGEFQNRVTQRLPITQQFLTNLFLVATTNVTQKIPWELIVQSIPLPLWTRHCDGAT